MIISKKGFFDKISSLRVNSNYLINNERYSQLRDEVKAAKAKGKLSKTSMEYNRIHRFDIITVGDEEQIIAAMDDSQSGNLDKIRYTTGFASHFKMGGKA